MSADRRGFTLLELLAVIVIIGIVAVLLLSAISRDLRHPPSDYCANNLSQLWKMQNIYMSKFGGPEKLMYPGTGKDFWLHLMSTQPPLIEPSVVDIYSCPAQDYEPDGTHYLGPHSDVNALDEGDLVGCDERLHPREMTLCVLRKSGDVSILKE